MEELIMKYIVEEMLIVIPVLLVLGKILKDFTALYNAYIPFILLAFGIGLVFAKMGINVDSFIQGVLVSGASVFVHELFKQGNEIRQYNRYDY